MVISPLNPAPSGYFGPPWQLPVPTTEVGEMNFVVFSSGGYLCGICVLVLCGGSPVSRVASFGGGGATITCNVAPLAVVAPYGSDGVRYQRSI